jgi:uncharacterized protein GlcG (DUF336 family)
MMTLTLAQANTIVTKALEKARAMNIKPVTVVVLDDAGHLKAMQREDGASMFRFDVATGKAWAVPGKTRTSSLRWPQRPAASSCRRSAAC